MLKMMQTQQKDFMLNTFKQLVRFLENLQWNSMYVIITDPNQVYVKYFSDKNPSIKELYSCQMLC